MKPRIGPRPDPRTVVDGFVDLNQLALDPKYEKRAAPLSKRRGGIGPAGRNDKFFFGALYPGQVRQESDALNGATGLSGAVWDEPSYIPWLALGAFLWFARPR